MRAGISLVEMLLVLVVLGILLTVGSVSLVRYLQIQTIREASAQLVGDLYRARTQARRTSQSWEMRASPSATHYEIGPQGNRRTVQLPSGVRFVQTGNVQLLYQAPYGTLGSPNQTLRIQGPGGHEREINLIGLTGKEVVRVP